MNPADSSEPTTFALDVYFAAGARGDAVLSAHVESCARCTAYLAQLSAQPALALPQPIAARRQRSAPRWIAASAALSACAVLAVWLRGGEYVGSKGVPAVQALIRGSDRARVWDGKTPIRAGDAIALRTGCDRFTHVAVVVARSGARGARGARGDRARVFDGPCSEQEPLPFTLVADQEPGSERIEVVFSRAALDDAALHRALERGERSEEAWVSQLVLHKAGAKP